jgi:hypothetical protein
MPKIDKESFCIAQTDYKHFQNKKLQLKMFTHAMNFFKKTHVLQI